MTDLAQFLRDRYAERRAIAEATKPGPWHADGGSVYATHPTDEVVDYSESADHIAANDPADVLADLEAKVALLDDLLATPHDANHEDAWYSCATITEGGAACLDERRAGKPCDCGRDARVDRLLLILAKPFAGHPEFEGEWAA